jgi:hypothetical protein
MSVHGDEGPPARPLDLWRAPAFLDYVQPPLTAEAVDGAESQFGVKLAPAYLDLLAVQNGGYLRATWPDSPHRRLDGIGPSFPSITLDGAWWRDADAEAEMWVPSQRQLLLPFDGEGHWDLCFDYRQRGPEAEPAVTYVDVEMEEDSVVAPSFDRFLAGLVDELEATAIRIYAEVGVDELAGALAGASGRDVDDQGSWNHGYPVRRLGMGEGGSAWVTPNRVPAGFRRDGEDVVATPETALRLPSDPRCRVLVEVTPDAEVPTREALLACGFLDT